MPIDIQTRTVLDLHLKQIERLTDLLGRVVAQQAELCNRLTALEAIALKPKPALPII